MTQHFSDNSPGCDNPDMYRVYGQYELPTDIPVDTGAMYKYIFGTWSYIHHIHAYNIQCACTIHLLTNIAILPSQKHNKKNL